MKTNSLLLTGGSALMLWGAYEALSPRKRIVRAASAEVGNTRWEKYLEGVAEHPSTPVAWCGIFALWALHQAGVLREVPWIYEKGFLYRLQKTTDPKPGDVAYISQPYQHHAIVESVSPTSVTTIDGNSSGKVSRNVRPRSAFSDFYRTVG